jgi:hypothetical protein
MAADLGAVWQFFTYILWAIGASLTFDTATFELVLNSPQARSVSIAVLVLAGLSHLFGQLIVLRLNRAPASARLKAIGLGTLLQVGDFVLWMLVIWVIAGVIFGAQRSLGDAFRVLAIAYAPMILGILVMVPYAGPALFQGLRLWTVLSVIVATSVTFGLPPGAAAVCAVGGWICHYLLVQAIGRLTGTNKSAPQPSLGLSARLKVLAAEEGRRGTLND